MLVTIDLERNDLGRVCEPGSVEVDELMVLESYAHVHHIVSNVRGVLRPGASPVDAVRAVFPGGTITGCPKVRCMEIIAELEQALRDLGQTSADLEEEIDGEELAVDTRLMRLLGLLEPTEDLETMLVERYTEQVAGFYDGDTEEMVVPAAPEGFTALQRLTVLHELVHALTDQHFDFNDEFETLIDEGNGDDSSAYQALIEGDATRSQFVYMESMSPIEAVEAAKEALTYASPVLD